MVVATSGTASRLQLADLATLRGEQDEALVEASKAGNDLAFRTLMERHMGMVRRLVQNIVRDEHESEDVVQDVFVSVWKSRESWKPDAKFTTWLHRVAINKAVDRYRRRGATPEPQDIIIQLADRAVSLDDIGDQQQELEQRQSSGTLRKALERLPANQRQALTLYYFEDFDVAKIGAIMTCSEQAVRSLLKRGRHALRAHLQKQKRAFGYGFVGVQGAVGGSRR
jgi:RNA polymerase sigma-70 factor, ECF subfamily